MTGFILSLALLGAGADADADARAALALAAANAKHQPKAEPVKPVAPVTPAPVKPAPAPAPAPSPIPAPKPKLRPTYHALCSEAIAKGVPILLAVSCHPATPDGYLVYYGYPGEFEAEEMGLIIGVPRNGTLIRIDLPPNANTARVRRAVDDLRQSWKQVAPMASPFFSGAATVEGSCGPAGCSSGGVSSGRWMPGYFFLGRGR